MGSFGVFFVILVLGVLALAGLALALAAARASSRRRPALPANCGDCVYMIPRAKVYFFFSSRRRHTICGRDWSSDVCSSDLGDHRRQRHRGGFAEGPRYRTGLVHGPFVDGYFFL